jgi:hypothetical protein
VTLDNVARFDGKEWHAMAGGLPRSGVGQLCVVDLDGDGPEGPQLFVSAAILPPTSGLGRWTGSAWERITGAMNFAQINDMTAYDADGTGPVAPRLMLAGGIRMLDGTLYTMASWDGTTFTQLSGYDFSWIGAITVFDEDGAGPGLPGLYTLGLQQPWIRRFDGTQWSEIAAGDIDLSQTGSPQAAVVDDDGPGANPPGLYVSGGFTRAGDTPSGYIARLGCAAGPVCTTDWDHNGTVNSTDVSAFINDWFEDQVEGTLVTDWDGNGMVNSTDVSDFINAWFEQTAKGCG